MIANDSVNGCGLGIGSVRVGGREVAVVGSCFYAVGCRSLSSSLSLPPLIFRCVCLI